MNISGYWVEVTIAENPSILEELSVSFFQMGCQGINEHENSFTLYFPKDGWDETKKSKLNSILEQKNISDTRVSISSLKGENWNENWKENFKTFRVGQNIIVIPDWETYQPKESEQVITIASKMAFGTGHHETTQLILKQLEEIIKPGMSVIDAGTGSAILSIYTALKGASKIIAFDNDPVAIENGLENAQLNNVADKIDLRCCTLKDIENEPYDIIVANINRNILLELAHNFNSYAHKKTILVLSGLLIKDRNEILNAYTIEGWKLVKSDEQGEWLSLNFVYS